ncbi:Small heat shock protein HSP20 protein [Dioscorea alata]|uniref:Small heat shock protein HSP20 protein n=1 Tax=Dioscorea alata TaxID=55571 RepID=A0ACB7U7B0_DIOAL|nr:Small heat shock protein HSP20 protein [Dioscorea alata]
MADPYYYYPNSPYYSNYSYNNQAPRFPIHLCFFLFILFLLLGFSWYLNYEPLMEGLMEKMKLGFILSPLVLLLALQFFSIVSEWRSDYFYSGGGSRGGGGGGGGSPWGVAFILVLLMFMISYQSYFRESWFLPLRR